MVRGAAGGGGGGRLPLFGRLEANMLKYKGAPPTTPLVSRTLATSLSGGLSSACRTNFNNPTPPITPQPPSSLLSPPLLSHSISLSPPPPPFTSPIPGSHTPMATIISPSSPNDQRQLPTATLALPATASASRRLPPPCWTPDETVALIDAYKDKWYSLRRGNLRANHWQEVADDVASRCPANPPKTAVQCRHKMEKLRKRYRAEIQRSAVRGGRSTSSWAHFQNMNSMEKGSNNPTPPSTSSSSDEDEDSKNNSVKRINDLYSHHSNHFPNQNPETVDNGSRPGVRIKIPGGVGGARFEATNPNPNPGWRSKVGVLGKRRGGDVVGAIQALGEGFMRMEKMKMEMARRMEEMRMEMELKRTEMILESQQRIVYAFAYAINNPHLPT